MSIIVILIPNFERHQIIWWRQGMPCSLMDAQLALMRLASSTPQLRRGQEKGTVPKGYSPVWLCGCEGIPGRKLPAFQSDQYVTYLDKCSAAHPPPTHAAAMSCLRSTNNDATFYIRTLIYSEQNPVLTWPFQPTQGGLLLEGLGSQSGYDETFFHIQVTTSTGSDKRECYKRGDLEANDKFFAYFFNSSLPT
jgi:hypothetical protein